MDGDTARWAAILEVVAQETKQRGEQGWLVGGCLRDALLGIPVHDIDLAVSGDPLVLAQAIRTRLGAAIAPLNGVTVRLALSDTHDPSQRRELDLSTRHGTTIEDDLVRRDFRINALALPLSARDEFVALLERAHQGGDAIPAGNDETRISRPAHLLDPLQGLADLRARRLTPASSHALQDDLGRILRAARLIASHALTPTPALLDAARICAPLLRTLPRDRVRDESNALLSLPQAWRGLDMLAECGALTLLTDDAPREALAHATASIRATRVIQHQEPTDTLYSGLAHLLTLDAVRAWCLAPLRDGLPRVVALRWGLLLHALVDAGVPMQGSNGEAAAQHVLERLPLAAHTRQIVSAVQTCGVWRERLLEHMPGEAELRHFFARYGERGIDALIGAVACDDARGEIASGERGDTGATIAERVRMIVALFFEERDRLIPPPLLNGTDLMRELGVMPGPAIKAALHAVRAAQLDGTITTRAEALDVAARYVRAEHPAG